MKFVKLNNEIVEIDNNCVDMVLFFNDIGLKTKYCCEGHKNGEAYQIIFDSDVEDRDIVSFIKNISKTYKHTPLAGTFKKWCRQVDGEIWFNWEYDLNFGFYQRNIRLALDDLRTMKEKYCNEVQRH